MFTIFFLKITTMVNFIKEKRGSSFTKYILLLNFNLI